MPRKLLRPRPPNDLCITADITEFLQKTIHQIKGKNRKSRAQSTVKQLDHYAWVLCRDGNREKFRSRKANNMREIGVALPRNLRSLNIKIKVGKHLISKTLTLTKRHSPIKHQ